MKISLSFGACLILAAATAACSTVSARPGSVALVERVDAKRPPIYSRLENVPGIFSVVGDVQVDNRGRSLKEIEQELLALAIAQGGDAIVLHPFNRRRLNVAFAVDRHEHDPLISSRATVIRMRPAPSADGSANAN